LSHTYDDQSVSRRGFLKAAAVTAAAATATGAGAAFVKHGVQPDTPPSIPSLPSFKSAPGVETEYVAEMFAKLAAAQAENVRLQASLDAAQRRLKAEQSDGREEALRVELENANAQVGVLGGLLALYEQLEGADFGDLLDDGVASVSAAIADLMDELPSLTEGIEAGRQALDDLEGRIPLLEEGRRWLDDHLDRLQGAFGAIEQILATAADAAGSVLQMLNEWFQDIRRWLPFGLGQRASEVMQAIANVLGETPDTINGLKRHIAEPMDAWLGDGGDDAPLRRDLVKPLREQVLAKAYRTREQAEEVQTVYQTQLVEPTQTAKSSKEAVRAQIAAYRQRHQI
jgi:hypothetical protein